MADTTLWRDRVGIVEVVSLTFWKGQKSVRLSLEDSLYSTVWQRLYIVTG